MEAKQATANGDGLKEVALGAPAFFEIDTHGIDGLVDVRIIGKYLLTLRGRLAINLELLIGLDVCFYLRAWREHHRQPDYQDEKRVLPRRVRT